MFPSTQQRESASGSTFSTASPPPAPSNPTSKRSVAFEERVKEANSDPDAESVEEIEMSFLMKVLRPVLGWMTPYEQMVFLRRKRDLKRWELFRDALMRRWSSLNVICGLIMGAVSTIVFADFPLSKASFTLEIISLLSSLTAIGFGVGLIYVLGDVRGSSIVLVDDRYPRLHLFALSIPEIWALVSFASFFSGLSVIVWEADNKGWVVKAGVAMASAALVGHLIAFGFLFREQDTTAFLIPNEPVFPSDSGKAEIRESPEPSHSRQQSTGNGPNLEDDIIKAKPTDLDGAISRVRVPSRRLMSSETLVESRDASLATLRLSPVRAHTAPVSAAPSQNSISFQPGLEESAPIPARLVAHTSGNNGSERV